MSIENLQAMPVIFYGFYKSFNNFNKKKYIFIVYTLLMLLRLPQSMLVLWARVHWPTGRRRYISICLPYLLAAASGLTVGVRGAGGGQEAEQRLHQVPVAQHHALQHANMSVMLDDVGNGMDSTSNNELLLFPLASSPSIAISI